MNVPDNSPEYYKRSILVPGVARRQILARLTYCLHSGANEKRVFLLTPYDRKFLAPGQSAHWEQLTQETNNQLSGNFHQDKFLVKKILRDSAEFPHFGIAIHHFGPVPVLMTNYSYKGHLHGEEVVAQVVLYFNRPSEHGVQLRGMFPNNLVLLQSLTGNYDLIMQRYFEDVAQIFIAITLKSGLPEAFSWSKQAEDFIGQSIQSKLRESIPTVEDWRLFNTGQLNRAEEEKIARCELFRDHHTDIFLAQYFRNTALYFINEFYRHLGLESRSTDYINRIESTNKEYDALHGIGAAQQLLQNIFEITELNRLRQLYQQNDVRQMNNMASDEVWLQGMISFTQFLANLNQHYIPPAKGRIFISYNHRVPSSEHLKNQIKDYYHTHNKENIEVLTVEGQPAGTDFIDVIKTRIWQADRMFVIVPKNNTKLGADGAGSYQWLAREAEHGFFLGKTVTFLLESDYDKRLLESSLGNEDMDFLTPITGKVSARTQKLLTDFKKRTQVEFSPSLDGPNSSWEDLNKEMRDALSHNAERAVGMRHHNMVRGFLSQFPEETLITIMSLKKIFSKFEINKVTKDDSELLLYQEFGTNPNLPFLTKSKTRRAFENAWNNTRTRSFEFNGVSYNVMIIEREGNKHYYSLSFDQLLKALQPDISEERIQKWIETLLNEVVAEKAKNP